MSAASDTIASLRGDGAEIIAIGAVMLVLAVCSVVLRLLAKAVNEKEYGFDDVLVGFALASYLVSEALVIRGSFLNIFFLLDRKIVKVLTMLQRSTWVGEQLMGSLLSMVYSCSSLGSTLFFTGPLQPLRHSVCSHSIDGSSLHIVSFPFLP